MVKNFGKHPKMFTSFAMCLTQYFIVHRLYFTPIKIDVCLKCKRMNGDYMHMFWYCQHLKTFWEKIVDLINTLYIFKVNIEANPVSSLLGDIISYTP